MDKNNVELFKQAINEAISNRFDKTSNACTEEIVCSERHDIAMRAIIYGKTDRKKAWTPKMRRIIAILVAAVLLLTGCGIIFHNEIRDFVENVYEFFVVITHNDKHSSRDEIEEIYEPTYMPEGYSLEESIVLIGSVNYRFVNNDNNIILFEQHALDGTFLVIDSESGYSEIKDIENYNMYHRYTNRNHYYIWNDGKYGLRIRSTVELSVDELLSIIDGIVTK